MQMEKKGGWRGICLQLVFENLYNFNHMTWEIPEVYIIFCFFAIDPWDLGKLFSTICLQQTAGGISKRSAVPN